MRPLALVLAMIGLARVGLAEIAVLESGQILYVDRYQRLGEEITLHLTGGGEVMVPAEIVVNVVPNEIVETGEDIQEIQLLPQWEPVIRPAAEKYDLDPNLVAAVIWAESSGDPDAVSKKGARGLMQLLPSTARELGVDNILDPRDNVDGGTHYLRRCSTRMMAISSSRSLTMRGPMPSGGTAAYLLTRKRALTSHV